MHHIFLHRLDPVFFRGPYESQNLHRWDVSWGTYIYALALPCDCRGLGAGLTAFAWLLLQQYRSWRPSYQPYQLRIYSSITLLTCCTPARQSLPCSYSFSQVIDSQISLQAAMNLQLLLCAAYLGLFDLVNARPQVPAPSTECVIQEAVCLLHPSVMLLYW